jgi:transposase
MKKQEKLTRKINRYLKRLGCPRWLHHFGPKKYEFKQHIFALLMKEVLKLSFRRCERILKMLGFNVPTYSALCKCRKRIPIELWNSLLVLTSGGYHYFFAVDSTGFSRTNPSYHYVKRIATKKPIKNYVKLSAFFNLSTKKFAALRVRMKPRHDVKDVNYLLKMSSPREKLFGDSAYDAEWIHEICFDKQIQTMIKPRENVKKGFYRLKQMKEFDKEEYNQRNGIEGGFGSVKRKYGGSVSGKCWKSVRTEIYLKAISHNLSLAA